MNKKLHFWVLSIAALLFLSTGLVAQEQVEVSIKVKKDGKVVQDTVYQFENASEAKHAMKMMEVMSGDDEQMEDIHYNYTTAHTGSKEGKVMVFISEDGEATEIKEIHEDSAVWVSKQEGDEAHGEHVIIMKSEDGNTFDVLVDEDFESGDVKKKKIKVMVSGDEEVAWTEMEGDDDVEVIVIKKVKKHKDSDHDEEHDHDEDCDHDEDVEVKVIKKKAKK